MTSQGTIIPHLIRLFNRDLDKLKLELNAYQDFSNCWRIEPNISNSAGNLALHLIGNLNHFIGASLGNTGYVRQRDLEFFQKDVPLMELIELIDDTKEMIASVFLTISKEELESEFRRNPFDEYMTTEYFLMHLLTHLSYHLGQINYHRRLIEA